MKGFIISIGKMIINPISQRLGYKRIHRQQTELLSKNNLLQNLFEILTKINFNPRHIVDVGANHGTWTRETIKYFPDAYYTLIEPQAQMVTSIQDILQINPKVKFYGIGAGKKAGTFKFTIVDRDDSCSFSYSEEEARSLGFSQVDVPVVTLNDFLPINGLPIPDIIKIDAEGLDLEVLSGSNNYLGQTEIFIVEASVLNKTFDNSILKMMVFMDNNGYKLFDLTDLNRTQKYNALWLVELVFIKKNGSVDNSVSSYI